MPNLKSEKHHWWPDCVSSHWAAEDGTTGWIKPDGSCIRVPPKNLGLIGNGHHIKLGRNPGDSNHWDTSFEREFDAADGNFPQIISWLNSLNRDDKPSQKLRDRFLEQSADDATLRTLTECVVSLAVRGSMNREASVFLAEHLRGPIPKQERETLIGLNMRNSQRIISDSIGSNAKFAVLFSQGKEFIFGDGFFHNVKAVGNLPIHPTILAPITPNLSVIVTRPTAFTVSPRLSTIALTDEEIDRSIDATMPFKSILVRHSTSGIINPILWKHLPVTSIANIRTQTIPLTTSFVAYLGYHQGIDLSTFSCVVFKMNPNVWHNWH